MQCFRMFDWFNNLRFSGFSEQNKFNDILTKKKSGDLRSPRFSPTITMFKSPAVAGDGVDTSVLKEPLALDLYDLCGSVFVVLSALFVSVFVGLI